MGIGCWAFPFHQSRWGPMYCIYAYLKFISSILSPSIIPVRVQRHIKKWKKKKKCFATCNRWAPSFLTHGRIKTNPLEKFVLETSNHLPALPLKTIHRICYWELDIWTDNCTFHKSGQVLNKEGKSSEKKEWPERFHRQEAKQKANKNNFTPHCKMLIISFFILKKLLVDIKMACMQGETVEELRASFSQKLHRDMNHHMQRAD